MLLCVTVCSTGLYENLIDLLLSDIMLELLLHF